MSVLFVPIDFLVRGYVGCGYGGRGMVGKLRSCGFDGGGGGNEIVTLSGGFRGGVAASLQGDIGLATVGDLFLPVSVPVSGGFGLAILVQLLISSLPLVFLLQQRISLCKVSTNRHLRLRQTPKSSSPTSIQRARDRK